MKLKDLNLNGDIEFPEIPTMYDMSEEDYRDYVRKDGVFWVDHHDILREAVTSRSLATTLEQFDILIEELTKWRNRMQPKHG